MKSLGLLLLVIPSTIASMGCGVQVSKLDLGVHSPSTSPNGIDSLPTTTQMPDAIPGVPRPVPQTDNTTITFSEYPVGTSITNQYQNLGITFSGDSPFISTDASNPTSPVLSGSPQFEGSIVGTFVDPKTGQPSTVSEFELDAGYFNDYNSTELTWYDISGKELGHQLNTNSNGIQRFVINSKQSQISSWQIAIVTEEDAGYAVDNVSFNRPSAACGDVRDKIIAEYSTFRVALTPVCDNFTQTASNADYSFADFDSGDYAWALIRQPLVIPNGQGDGLEAWVYFIGSAPTMNSGYRNPAHNASAGGAKGSRHQFGDAVDLKNETRTLAEHNTLASAAHLAHADFVEPVDKKFYCKLACVHADWRNHPGPFTP